MEFRLIIIPSVTLGLTWNPNEPEHYTDHQWIGFAVVLLANLIGLVVIVARSDFVWCVASVWINIAIWSTGPKPRPVIVCEHPAHPIGLLLTTPHRSLGFCSWYCTPLLSRAFCYGDSRWVGAKEESGFLKMARRETYKPRTVNNISTLSPESSLCFSVQKCCPTTGVVVYYCVLNRV